MNQPKDSPAAVRIAERLAEIEQFHVIALVTRAFELEAQGKQIVNMVIGEPDFPTPQPIVDAAIDALRNRQIRYTPSLGGDELRGELQNWYRIRYGVDLPKSRIAVTSGSSAALLLTMGALLSPGDQVLMADPSYPANRHFVRAMEGRAVTVPVNAASAYQLTAELVEKNCHDCDLQSPWLGSPDSNHSIGGQQVSACRAPAWFVRRQQRNVDLGRDRHFTLEKANQRFPNHSDCR